MISRLRRSMSFGSLSSGDHPTKSMKTTKAKESGRQTGIPSIEKHNKEEKVDKETEDEFAEDEFDDDLMSDDEGNGQHATPENKATVQTNATVQIKATVENKATTAERGRPPLNPEPSQRGRSRSGSLRDFFRRKNSSSELTVDNDGTSKSGADAASVSSDGSHRSRSFSNPFRLFRSRSRSASSDTDPALKGGNKNEKVQQQQQRQQEKQSGKLLRRGSSFSLGWLRSGLSGNDADNTSVGGKSGSITSSLVDGPTPKSEVPKLEDKPKKPRRLRLSKHASRLVKKLSSGNLFAFGDAKKAAQEASKTQNPQTNTKNAPLVSPRSGASESEAASVGSPRGAALEQASFPYRHHFSRADVLYFRSIHETTTTMFETLSELIGEGENELLLARLAEMVDDQDDLFRAMALIRSTNPSERLPLLWRMHDVSGSLRGVSREDLRSVLRYAVSLTLPSAGPKIEASAEADLSMLPMLRLERFYKFHAPDKLTRIRSILDKYQGRIPLLWKKLEKQYPGAIVPPEQDVFPLLNALPVIEELVEDAFSRESAGSTHLGLEAFSSWIATLEPRLAPDESIRSAIPRSKGVKSDDWRQDYRSTPPSSTTLSGWMRFAQLSYVPAGRRLKLSELSWRRRWCSTVVQPDGSIALEVSKTPDELPIALVRLSGGSGVNVDCIERADHKHRWTILINQQYVLQPSRASADGIDIWLYALRTASHAGQNKASERKKHDEGSDDDDDENEEEEEEEIKEDDGENDRMEQQIIAFYLDNNPEKVADAKKIALKYRGNEKKLFALLEKQYPGGKVPSPGTARRRVASSNLGSPRSEASGPSAMTSSTGNGTPVKPSPSPSSYSSSSGDNNRTNISPPRLREHSRGARVPPPASSPSPVGLSSPVGSSSPLSSSSRLSSRHDASYEGDDHDDDDDDDEYGQVEEYDDDDDDDSDDTE
jgi:hypothetical protein